MYRNATYFRILILYPETSLNSLIRPNDFLVEPLGFSGYKIMPFENRENFTSSFLILTFYFFFLPDCFG